MKGKKGGKSKMKLQLEELGRMRGKGKKGEREDERKDSLKGELEEDPTQGLAVENLYVTLPLPPSNQSSPEKSHYSSPEESPRPPSEPPPPLPASSPPPGEYSTSTRTTVYENCWVEPSTGAAGLALPPLPARPMRTHSCRESGAPDNKVESGKAHLLLDSS